MQPWLDKVLDERRFRVVYVSIEQFVRVLNFATANSKSYLRLPETPEIPEDVHVHNVTYAYDRNAWAIVIAHPTFEPTSPASYIPHHVDVMLQFRDVILSGREIVREK